MRGFVRAFSLLLVFLAPFLLPPTAFSQERRLVVTEGADYFGSDYDVRKGRRPRPVQGGLPGRQAVPGLHLQFFGALVLPEERRRRVAGGCRRDLRPHRRRRRPRPGPTSPPSASSELGFSISPMSTRRGTSSARFPISRPPTRMPTARSRPPSRPRIAAILLSALDHYTDALKFRPDDFGLWMRFTDTAINASSDDCEVQQTLSINRTAGAINAYLHAVSPEERAQALDRSRLVARRPLRLEAGDPRLSREPRARRERIDARHLRQRRRRARLPHRRQHRGGGRRGAAHLPEFLRPARGRPRLRRLRQRRGRHQSRGRRRAASRSASTASSMAAATT